MKIELGTLLFWRVFSKRRRRGDVLCSLFCFSFCWRRKKKRRWRRSGGYVLFYEDESLRVDEEICHSSTCNLFRIGLKNYKYIIFYIKRQPILFFKWPVKKKVLSAPRCFVKGGQSERLPQCASPIQGEPPMLTLAPRHTPECVFQNTNYTKHFCNHSLPMIFNSWKACIC